MRGCGELVLDTSGLFCRQPGAKGRAGGKVEGKCQRFADMDTRSREAVASGRHCVSVCLSGILTSGRGQGRQPPRHK